MSEILSGGLNWGSTQQAIVTMDKEGHPLTCCNPVTGECLGGGGTSEFSTATLTFNKIDTSAKLEYLPHMSENMLIATPEADDKDYIIPVPKDGTTGGVLTIDSVYTELQTAGAIQLNPIPDTNNYIMIISGDCSITIVYND